MLRVLSELRLEVILATLRDVTDQVIFMFDQGTVDTVVTTTGCVAIFLGSRSLDGMSRFSPLLNLVLIDIDVGHSR
jgi:hypothetical protein